MRRFSLLLILSVGLVARSGQGQWTLTQNSHLELYSQGGGATATAEFTWFEQLRAFFEQSGVLGATFNDQNRPPLRVISLQSEKEYENFRLRSLSDAYYISDGERDYIVMAALHAGNFDLAAHEYLHYVLHVNGLKLPGWLNEGLAEFFSTLHFAGNSYELGGDLPARTQTLRKNKWLPLADVLNLAGPVPVPYTRKNVDMFYAESWALADMLIMSPQYAAHFHQFVSELGASATTAAAFQKIYGKSPEEIRTSLEIWAGQPHSARFVLHKPAGVAARRNSELSQRQAAVLLAQLALVSGHLDQAHVRYQELLRETPGDPDIRAALGVIALRQGNKQEAMLQWREAINGQVKDAELCYRYALLAEEAEADARDIKNALERAIALAPGFDDARYKLALMENHAGEYESAVGQFLAMRVPVGERRYAYWIALASALTDLDRRDEARAAAYEAVKAAQTDQDRMRARVMAYTAVTDLTVQFATDADGRSHMVTTRVPHGTANWNPFIEASDHMRRADGKLTEVLCAAGQLTGFRLRTDEGTVTVDVPDPSHVLMLNSPTEFFCGPTQEKAIEADYAIVETAGKRTNLLRGMTFH